MNTEEAKKRVRRKRTHPFLTSFVISAQEINEHGENKHTGFVQTFPLPLRWSPDQGVIYRIGVGNFIVSISPGRIKRWPRKKKST